MGSVFAGLIVKNRYVRAQFLTNLVASNGSVNPKWPEFLFVFFGLLSLSWPASRYFNYANALPGV